MALKIDLINQVLSELGKNPVENANDSEAAQYISRKLDEFLPRLIVKRNWTFLKKYVSNNTPLTVNFSPDYVYSYQLPADFGTFYKWATSGAQWSVYEFCDGMLLANTRPIKYWYIVNTTDFTILSPLASYALVLWVAAKCAPTLTNNIKLSRSLMSDYVDALADAIREDDMLRPVVGMPYNDYDRINLI
jgi:hypothetical protein